MSIREERMKEANKSIDKIVSFVEFHYNKPFPRFRKQLIGMCKEYYKNPKMFFMSDGLLADSLRENCKADSYEFIYFPDMAMSITNIAWHSDLIREFLFDLDHPKLKGVDFNDMPYQGTKKGIIGFVSSVSNNMQIDKRYLCNQDKEYLERFLK